MPSRAETRRPRERDLSTNVVADIVFGFSDRLDHILSMPRGTDLATVLPGGVSGPPVLFIPGQILNADVKFDGVTYRLHMGFKKVNTDDSFTASEQFRRGNLTLGSASDFRAPLTEGLSFSGSRIYGPLGIIESEGAQINYRKGRAMNPGKDATKQSHLREVKRMLLYRFVSDEPTQ